MAKLHKESSFATKLYLSVEIGVFILAETPLGPSLTNLSRIDTRCAFLTEREKCGFEAIVFSGRDGLRDVPNSISSAALFEPGRLLAYH